MAMLSCIHFVSWVIPVEAGQHRCRYCGEIVTKKTLYPKFDDLGAEFQRRWDAHEATGPAPVAPAKPAAPKPAEAKPAEAKPAEPAPAEAAKPAAEAK